VSSAVHPTTIVAGILNNLSYVFPTIIYNLPRPWLNFIGSAAALQSDNIRDLRGSFQAPARLDGSRLDAEK
jgi:hypothetical protein